MWKYMQCFDCVHLFALSLRHGCSLSAYDLICGECGDRWNSNISMNMLE